MKPRPALLAAVLLLSGCSAPPAPPARPKVNAIAAVLPRPTASVLPPGPAPVVARKDGLNPFDVGPSWGTDTRDEPSDAKNTCEVANRNIQAALDAVMLQPLPSGKAAPRKVWSKESAAGYQKLVEGRYGLTAAELALLKQSGFVVLGRLSRPSYAHAYHDIFQSQLPVYVTMDSLFHAVFKAHEALVVHVESDLLLPRVKLVVDGLRSALLASGAELPAEIRRDIDLYLAIAASLLSGQTKAGVTADLGAEVSSMLALVEKADALTQVDLFGRARMVDFSQYRPRGHYATHEALIPYFKAMMWLTRIELNIVSRSSRSSAPGAAPDPRETPREAMMALALSRLAEQARIPTILGEIEEALHALGGKREDIRPSELLALHRRAGAGKLDDAQTFESLKREIGSGFVRTARIHYMPQGSTELPVIFTLLGPRITKDTAITRLLVHGETPDRYDLHISDMAYALGHDQARDYLRADLARFPTLGAKLAEARRAMSELQGDDLYTTWLSAIRELSKEPPAHAPSFMKTKPFRDLRINSTVAAYGQLRRNNVLIAGQGYEEGGCEIPDGYVEPAPEVLDRLIAFSERASTLLTKLGEPPPTEAKHKSPLAALFPRMTGIFKALRRIVDREIQGEPLSEPEKRLLATVAEIIPATSGSPPRYTGWYFQLFDHRRTALATPSFIGDYYTSSNTSQVAYAGAGDPVMGVFVVDVGGSARMMIGPIARAYELHAPLSQRLTDEEGRLQPNKVSPWMSSFLVEDKAPPTIRLFEDEEHISGSTATYEIRSKQRIQSLKLELLSHHGQPCGEGRTTMAGTRGRLQLKLAKTTDEDPCTGGYRLTLDGQSYNVDMSYPPTDIGLGDMWALQLEEEPGQ